MTPPEVNGTIRRAAAIVWQHQKRSRHFGSAGNVKGHYPWMVNSGRVVNPARVRMSRNTEPGQATFSIAPLRLDVKCFALRALRLGERQKTSPPSEGI